MKHQFNEFIGIFITAFSHNRPPQEQEQSLVRYVALPTSSPDLQTRSDPTPNSFRYVRLSPIHLNSTHVKCFRRRKNYKTHAFLVEYRSDLIHVLLSCY